ncbi:MAG: tetratricopeptide repeat protein [Odoribacter sp.]
MCNILNMQMDNSDFAILYFCRVDEQAVKQTAFADAELKVIDFSLTQDEYINLLAGIKAEKVVLVNGAVVPLDSVKSFIRNNKQQFKEKEIGYVSSGKGKLWFRCIRNLWSADKDILSSPIIVGRKAVLLKAYGGGDLAGTSMGSIAYSLQKIGGLKFSRISIKEMQYVNYSFSKWSLWANYTICLPFRFLITGRFFTRLLAPGSKVQRDMVFRMLMFLFMCFTFVYMPYISRDYGISGDEFVDHRHAGYVLDYFAKGDKAALDQPKTALHLYGNSVQVIAAAIARWFNVDDYYGLRHFICGGVGALGVLAVGLMGMRWGGGLCGLLSVLLMFFTPRYFGHSMNNLKDVPFAVGYALSLFYTVRLFDYFPVFRLRHILGLVVGIGLALGTRSGGLILYPMLFMYAGLYYMLYYGVKDFYRFGKHRDGLGKILQVVMLVILCSYFLAILLWPFALQKPFSAVFYSLAKFTNYNIGLRTIFDGEQMMSNMLPWKYAPKYLCIGMPIVTVIGFFAYFIYMIVRKKEFSLISFFFLFATVFPVFWVIYQHSNLYGGIRHLLFVMPPMVVLAARFWSGIIQAVHAYYKWALSLIFGGLFLLPVIHIVHNHPNEYVYFNEFKGGLKGAYGDYETDYYFNSLKQSADWFKKNILPDLPKDKKTIIVTQAADPMTYYFRKDTNIKVIYSRYYEKYAKDWDYAMFGNVYISQFQLNNGLFPPEGTLYSPTVDGFPMSFVLKRQTKEELKGFEAEKKGDPQAALAAFETYIAGHKSNEEVWSRMGKLYYMTGQYQKAKIALENALQLHPSLNEALYMVTLVNLELKDYKAAFSSVGRMLAENSISVDAFYLRATIYYQLKQYQNAIADLNRILSYRPNYDRALVLAGNIFRDNGDYQQALKMYQAAIKFRNTINSQVQSADMLVRMKKYPEAVDILQQAVKVQDSFYPIYKVEARMYLQQGKMPEAEACLKRLEHMTKILNGGS